MAEPEVSAKAPESDAQERPAPKLSEHCTTERPTPSGQKPTGEMVKLGGVDVYISKPSEYPQAPAKLLLLLSGGQGVLSTNNQIQADHFASEGFVVVMPDLFDGDPVTNYAAFHADEQQDQTARQQDDDESRQDGGSVLGVFRKKAAETAKSFLIDMWLAKHTAERVLPIVHRVLDKARDEFADAVSSGGGVYAVGYCFGARYVLLLAGTRPLAPAGGGDVEAARPTTAGPHIKAGALAHATLVSRDDFAGLQAPVSLVCVENDPVFPDEVRTFGEDYMSKNKIEHEVQVYPGVPHGFAVVGEYEDESIKTAQTKAHGQMLKWLKEH